jgi:hypothetical protein
VSERRGGIAARWRENSTGGSEVPFLKGGDREAAEGESDDVWRRSGGERGGPGRGGGMTRHLAAAPGRWG